MKLMTNPASGPVFSIAQVTYSDSTGFGALDSGEARHMPVFGPRGFQWAPCEGDSVLMVRENGAEICLGALSANRGSPGEIYITTPGGAVLHMRNNGEIRLNDTVIPPPARRGGI
jgi:hypothetical protein